jgi:hypothetical protein
MKNQDTDAQGTPKKDQGAKEERRKKKKNEDPRPKTVKKAKVPKAIRIHTPSGSGEIPQSQDKPITEKKIVVEKDQHLNVAEDKVLGPKDDPKPQPEPSIKDQKVTDETKRDSLQKGGDAPNAEQQGDSLTNSEVETKEVISLYFLTLAFLQITHWSN